MDTSIDALAAVIGHRVRQQRDFLRWTLDQLAEEAGVSRRMIVNVEQGTVNPSVGILLKLAEALGVGLPQLVETPRPAALTITRAGEGAVLWSGDGGGRGVMVAATAAPDAFELWDWTLEPGDRHDSEPHGQGTKELAHVLTGSLTMHVGDKRIVLEPGDAVSFYADVPHAYENAGASAVRFSLAVLEPRAAARPNVQGERPAC